MFLRLCNELPNIQLKLVTKLELCWDVVTAPVSPSRTRTGAEKTSTNYEFPFQLLQLSFPGLRMLYVALEGNMLTFEERINLLGRNEAKVTQLVEEKEHALLGPVDAFLRAAAALCLRELHVSISSLLWKQLSPTSIRQQEEQTVPGDNRRSRDNQGQQFWRKVGGGLRSDLVGYWVVCGREI